MLISASLGGSVLSLFPWGIATDRVGERIVLVIGMGACGATLLEVRRRRPRLMPPLALLLAGGPG